MDTVQALEGQHAVCAPCQLNVALAKAGHLDNVATATAVLAADVDALASAEISKEIVRQGEVKVSSLVLALQHCMLCW